MNAVLKDAQLAISAPTHNILDVPDEILENILMLLPFDDIASLTLVCQRFSEIVKNSSSIWKHLLWSMYPGTSLLKYSNAKSAPYNYNDNFGDLDVLAESNIAHIDQDAGNSKDTDSPKLIKRLCLQMQRTNNYWKRQFGSRHSIGVLAKQWITRLSPQFFDLQDLSNVDMEQFLDLTKITTSWEEKSITDTLNDNEAMGREFIIDALLTLIHDGKKDCELTVKYYATKLIRYVRNSFARHFWVSFMTKETPELEDYYNGLVHFSQWFQPSTRICIASIKFDVDRIAISTLKHLSSKHPKHTIFDDTKQTNVNVQNVDKKQKNPFENYLSCDNSPDYEYSEKELFQVLDALNYVMFEVEGFRGNTSNYYNPNNSYIDKVLETRQGIPITLCILYMLIAERLRIRLEPINFPRHFLLRLKNDKTNETYIDVFQKGKRLSQQEVHQMDEENTAKYHVAKPIEVFQRMVRNMLAIGQMVENVSDSQSYSLLRAALELQKLIGADFEHPGFGLVQLYLQQNINHREVHEELNNYENWPLNMWIIENNQHLKQQVKNLRRLCMRQLEDNKKQLEENSKLDPKLRSEFKDVHGQSDHFEEMGLYSVGMVMKHKRYHYICVIYGWDSVCKQSKNWVRQMGVDRLRWKDMQPFYNVLVEDGSYRYAASENLFPAKPQRISGNPQVGKYFFEFDENIGYIANKELTTNYPEDAEVQVKFEGSWRKHRSSSSSNGEIN